MELQRLKRGIAIENGNEFYVLLNDDWGFEIKISIDGIGRLANEVA